MFLRCIQLSPVCGHRARLLASRNECAETLNEMAVGAKMSRRRPLGFRGLTDLEEEEEEEELPNGAASRG